MTSAIGSSTPVNLHLPTQVKTQQAQASTVDSDGDHDGSKPGEVEQPKATSGSVGTIINTKA
ncbi:hypothetical protein [Pseudomonas panipatensis]|uniref:Uncharacterized protein n=1 Tax=Pseudomonas panipatensis TaxID=428992 RepID=A0A1G8K2U8_9PSED|nr:hypothetical protein [Pseudomonas panipatensis]SDI37754.1 hypothetical protein SAMN05216272_108218 [Pseudomonas panipatensis]SMP61046.1 hypothetical protein SAMN06295951_105120 [Pseudomonas panipatensis]